MDPRKSISGIAQCISRSAAEMCDSLLQRGCISVQASTPRADLMAATSLEDYGFAYRQLIPGGYELLPTPFEILILSLVHRLDWSYPPFEALSGEERARLRVELAELQENLPFLAPASLPSPPMTQTIEGAANIDAFIARILLQTDDLCAFSAAEWSSNLPLVWAAILQRMRQAMRYRRIVSPVGLAAFGWKYNRRDVVEVGVDLRVSLTPPLSPFYLFAGNQPRSAVVYVPIASGNTQQRATYTSLGQLTERLARMFNDQWQTAVPASLILDRLLHFRSAYADRAGLACGSKAARVAELLFDDGVFAVLTPDDEGVLTCMLDSTLILRSNYTIGRIPYLPAIVDEIGNYVRQEQDSHDGTDL